MQPRSANRTSIILAVMIVLGLSSLAEAFQEKSKDKRQPTGTPVLWREPRDISSRDLYLGPGGVRMRPDLRKITFIKDEEGGYSTKFRVRDATGRVWVAKVGKEAQSETAAVRLLWALGYMTEINYLVPRVTIPGKGTFENVRFEARPEGVERLDEWKWDENPFRGTGAFQGLKVLMVLINNWDIKDSNNVILAVGGGRGGRGELRYAISDLGATFGKTGDLPLLWRIRRSRNDPEGFGKDKFINEVEEDGRVDFHFSGKKRDIFNDITVEQARWVGNLLSRLSDRQLRDMFRAANYPASEAQMLTAAVRRRAKALVRLSPRKR
jgi:hypothetical protein